MIDKSKHNPIVKTRINNFDVGDKIIINKEIPDYIEDGPLSDLKEGVIAHVNLIAEEHFDMKSIIVVWDNACVKLHSAKEIKLVDEESVLNRFTFDGEKLYFKDDIPATPDDVLPLLYKSTYDTAVATYYKNKYTILEQCVNGKHRSFDDIYYLFKAYFPETSHNDVMIKLLTYNVKEENFNNNYVPLQFATCSTMSRIRFIPAQVTSNVDGLLDLAFTSNKYNSFKDWSELFYGIDILNTADLKLFYTNHFNKNK